MCNLGKITAEFRVFNATSNPRKVLAYTALCQSLVARAITKGHPEGDALAWDGENEHGSRERAVLIAERTEWMVRHLALAPRERRALAACAADSTLAARLTEAGTSVEEVFSQRCRERFDAIEAPMVAAVR
jgi:hypothetical protein